MEHLECFGNDPGGASSRTPLEVLDACKTKGECGLCGACCELYPLDAPAQGAEGAGSVRLVDGVPLMYRKAFGERCVHLLSDGDRRLCALHGSPYQPSVCAEWRGNRLAIAVEDEDSVPPNAPTNFEQMREHALIAFRRPSHGTIPMLRRLAETGVLQVMLRDAPVFAGAFTGQDFFQRWILGAGVCDEQLFACAGFRAEMERHSLFQLKRWAALCELPGNRAADLFLERWLLPVINAKSDVSAAG